MGEQLRILLVDDNAADVVLIRKALDAAKLEVELEVVADGAAAIRRLHMSPGGPPCPQLLLLDLKLPRRGGDEVLRHVRGCGLCRHMRVVVVTSSDAPRDRQALGALGIDEYFKKPSDFAAFLQLGAIVRRVLAS